METEADVVVIGCGPGGSSVATFLARAGRRVVVLEKETFPRFHVGESLLPYNRSLFEELGVWPVLAAAGFPRKVGAQFQLAQGTKGHRFVFQEGAFTKQSEAIQVERATFDHLLMQQARQSGATVLEDWSVTGFTSAAEHLRVEARDGAGHCQTFQGSFLVDASGRGNVTGNQEKLRVVHPRHRKLAVFAHFADVALDAGEARGDTVIVRTENSWFWVIPISETRTSVGLVLDREQFMARGDDAEAVFRTTVQESAVMQRRMLAATRLGALHTTTDFSYTNQRLVSRRLVRIGDAAGFMDPIFSSGVYLAMWSGKLAAAVIQAALERGDDGARGLATYERRVRAAFRRYWRMIEGFYTTPFMELFLQPGPRWNLPAAVVALLAGELEGGWRLRWRLEVFYLLVRLQRWFQLVPRITFQPKAPSTSMGATAQE